MATMANKSFCQRYGCEVKPQALDCGESFCLAEPIEKIEQGLRGQSDFSRSVRQDRLHLVHGRAFGITLKIGSQAFKKMDYGRPQRIKQARRQAHE